VDDGQDCADVDLLAFVHGQFGDHSRKGRRDFVLHLHGLEPEEGLALFDHVTGRDR
jgi:hypothetical protein